MKLRALTVFLAFSANFVLAHPGQSLRVVYSYPMKGAMHVLPTTGIGITFSAPLDTQTLSRERINVAGSIGGEYHGSVKLSVNKKTLIFTPSAPFAYGETLHVQVLELPAAEADSLLSQFDISFVIRDSHVSPDPGFHSDDPLLENILHPSIGRSGALSLTRSSPLADTILMPQMNVVIDYFPTDGQMFLANYKYVTRQRNTFLMILDPHAAIEIAQDLEPDYANDFKPNGFGGYSYYDALKAAFMITDSNLAVTDSVRAPYGYVTDSHEFRVAPDGNLFLIGDDYQNIDMTNYVSYADTSAVLLVPVILEYDSDKNLIFEWRTIDHFQVTDATHENLYAHMIDFCHTNAIEFDGDSNLIISSRHLDEITKINRETGDIIWRWGGKNNQFSFVGDSIQFSHQHAIRRTDSGTYTMFDNGNFHLAQYPYSRALEYTLDQKNKVATEIWQFRHLPDVYSDAMGYVQRLPGGGTFIGWGECDDVSVTELDKKGVTLFEMQMTEGNYSYRAYKYDSSFTKSEALAAVPQKAADLASDLRCSPNPISANANIYLTSSLPKHVDLVLIDQLGRTVSNIFSGFVAAGNNSYSFSSAGLSDGVYYLCERETSAAPIVEKVLVVH